MAAWPNPYVPLLLIAALLTFEDWLSTPSCSGGSPAPEPASGDLRAMMVADLMLLGSDATYADRFFRDYLMSKLIAVSHLSSQIQMRAIQISSNCSCVCRCLHGKIG
jgi:hypothetical protein